MAFGHLIQVTIPVPPVVAVPAQPQHQLKLQLQLQLQAHVRLTQDVVVIIRDTVILTAQIVQEHAHWDVLTSGHRGRVTILVVSLVVEHVAQPLQRQEQPQLLVLGEVGVLVV